MEPGELAVDRGRRRCDDRGEAVEHAELALERSAPHRGTLALGRVCFEPGLDLVAPAPQHLATLVEAGDLDLEVRAQRRDCARPLIEAGARRVGEASSAGVGLFVGLERRKHRLELAVRACSAETDSASA